MSAFESAFEALRKTVGDVEADRLLTAVEAEKLREAAAELWTKTLLADDCACVEMLRAMATPAPPVPDNTTGDEGEHGQPPCLNCDSPVNSCGLCPNCDSCTDCTEGEVQS